MPSSLSLETGLSGVANVVFFNIECWAGRGAAVLSMERNVWPIAVMTFGSLRLEEPAPVFSVSAAFAVSPPWPARLFRVDDWFSVNLLVALSADCRTVLVSLPSFRSLL